MKRDAGLMRLAIKVAREGKGKFRHGALLVDGCRVIGVGINEMKTHPKLFYLAWPYLHAEMKVLFSEGLDNVKGMVVYVARVRRDGIVGNSRPCEKCMGFLREGGIKRVVYTTGEGYESERIRG